MFHYPNTGTCSRAVSFDIVDGHVCNVRFDGGCSGNTQGVASLVEGMDVHDAIARMKGIRCGYKDTSCPDQLACALEKALKRI
ncbi:MAG: TIGR03905 family TSCPD domain-containing protein [Clostridiaceae bacterium]|nr:TIGR03905 family TSCPD domain-containing protein [Clostridiaceae bacterium]